MGGLKEIHADNPELLYKNFFGEPAVMVPEFIEPSNEEWPTREKHTCKEGDSGWIITLRSSSPSSINHYTSRNYLSCDGCFYTKVKRHSKQILEEAANYFDGLGSMWVDDKATFNKLTNKWRQQRKRENIPIAYRAYPQDDGRYFVIHGQQDEPGSPIPTDKSDLFDLIWRVARTPAGKSISSSRAWGGRYQGNKGDGRAKQHDDKPEMVKQIWSTGSISKVAEIINIELDTKKKADINLDPREIVRRLDDAEIRYYLKNNGPSWDVFLAEMEKVRGPYIKPLTGGLAADTLKYEHYEPALSKNGQKGAEKVREMLPLVSYGAVT